MKQCTILHVSYYITYLILILGSDVTDFSVYYKELFLYARWLWIFPLLYSRASASKQC